MRGALWVLYQWLFEVVVASAKNALGIHTLIRAFTLYAIVLYFIIPVIWAGRKQVPFYFTTLVGSLVLGTLWW